MWNNCEYNQRLKQIIKYHLELIKSFKFKITNNLTCFSKILLISFDEIK